MSTLTKVTRTVKKLDMPRPLKSTTTSSAHNRNSVVDVKINSVDELIMLAENVASQIMKCNYDRSLPSNVSTMYSNLKLYGAQLEAMYKDLLDRYFVMFRNGSQDENLDKRTRLHLLELIELRAKHWQGSDYMSQYYRHRGTHAEPLLVPTMESGGSVSPTLLAAPADPPTLLAPGELIKPSGKFPKPTKIPGKNYSKDEVVIRNADSGKVSPGAKERLVQITGPNEENVNHAKHLIGDTIRRNASPVRLEADGSLQTSAQSDTDDDAVVPREKSPHNSRSLLHSFSTNDAALGEYKYTVTFGQQSVKITGNNLDLVKTAKLVLDEYFESSLALEAGAAGSGDFFTLSQRPGAAALLDDHHDDDVFIVDRTPSPEPAPRRPRFSRAASSDKPQGDLGSRRVYSYATLLQLADAPLSKLPPAGLSAFPADLARKVTPRSAPHGPALPVPHAPLVHRPPPRRYLPLDQYHPNYLASIICRNFY